MVVQRAHERRDPRWPSLTLIALAVGWAVFAFASNGSAEERYFRTCTGSCLAEMPASYKVEHALWTIATAGVPLVIAIAVWFFVGWLKPRQDD